MGGRVAMMDTCPKCGKEGCECDETCGCKAPEIADGPKLSPELETIEQSACWLPSVEWVVDGLIQAKVVDENEYSESKDDE